MRQSPMISGKNSILEGRSSSFWNTSKPGLLPDPNKNIAPLAREDSLSPTAASLEESEYEEISENYNARKMDKDLCSLCGNSSAVVGCEMCNNQNFCGACNDMYHRHPKRQSHVRKVLKAVETRPPLPPKSFIENRQRSNSELPPVPPHHGGMTPIAPPRRRKMAMIRSAANSPTFFANKGFDPVGSIRRAVNDMAHRPLPPTPKVSGSHAPPLPPKPGSRPITPAHTDGLGNDRQPSALGIIQIPHCPPARSSIPSSAFEMQNKRTQSVSNLPARRSSSFKESDWEEEELSKAFGHLRQDNFSRFSDSSQVSRNDASHFATIRKPDKRQKTPERPPPPLPPKNPQSQSVFDLDRLPPYQQQQLGMLPPWFFPQAYGFDFQQAAAAAMMGYPPGMLRKTSSSSSFAGSQPQFFGWGPMGYPAQVPDQLPPQESPFIMKPMPQRAGSVDPSFGANRNQYPSPVVQSQPPTPQESFRKNTLVNRRPSDALEETFQHHLQSPQTIGNTEKKKAFIRGNTAPPQQPADIKPKAEPNRPQKIQSSPKSKQLLSIADQKKDSMSSCSSPELTTDPEGPWSCEHCTFVNPKSLKICTICCKTPSSGYRSAVKKAPKAKQAQIKKKSTNQPENHEQKIEAEKITKKPSPTQSPSSDEYESFTDLEDRESDIEPEKMLKDTEANVLHPVQSDKESTDLPKITSTPSPGVESELKIDVCEKNLNVEDEQVLIVQSPKIGKKNIHQVIAESMEDIKGKSKQKLKLSRESVSKHSGNAVNQRVDNKSSQKMKKSNLVSASTQAEGIYETSEGKNVSNSTAKNEDEIGKSVGRSESLKASGQAERSQIGNQVERSTTFEKVTKGTSPPPQSISTQTEIEDNVLCITTPTSLSTSITKYGSKNSLQSHSDDQYLSHNVELSDKARRYIRKAENQHKAKLKRSHSTHLPTSMMLTDAWIDNSRDVMQMHRSSSRYSLASDARSLPISGPTSRESTPPVNTRLYEDLKRLKGSYGMHEKSQNSLEYYKTVEDLVNRKRRESLTNRTYDIQTLLQEARRNDYEVDDIEVALKMCSDKDPISWLNENWKSMIDTVKSLATQFGLEKGRNNHVGNITGLEARTSLREHKGNVWAAVTDCVERRERKVQELLERGHFNLQDILSALASTKGDMESAYVKLTKSHLKPFLERILQNPEDQYPNGRRMRKSMPDLARPMSAYSYSSSEYSDSNEEMLGLPARNTKLESLMSSAQKVTLQISQAMEQLKESGQGYKTEAKPFRRSSSSVARDDNPQRSLKNGSFSSKKKFHSPSITTTSDSVRSDEVEEESFKDALSTDSETGAILMKDKEGGSSPPCNDTNAQDSCEIDSKNQVSTDQRTQSDFQDAQSAFTSTATFADHVMHSLADALDDIKNLPNELKDEVANKIKHRLINKEDCIKPSEAGLDDLGIFETGPETLSTKETQEEQTKKENGQPSVDGTSGTSCSEQFDTKNNIAPQASGGLERKPRINSKAKFQEVELDKSTRENINKKVARYTRAAAARKRDSARHKSPEITRGRLILKRKSPSPSRISKRNRNRTQNIQISKQEIKKLTSTEIDTGVRDVDALTAAPENDNVSESEEGLLQVIQPEEEVSENSCSSDEESISKKSHENIENGFQDDPENVSTKNNLEFTDELNASLELKESETEESISECQNSPEIGKESSVFVAEKDSDESSNEDEIPTASPHEGEIEFIQQEMRSDESEAGGSNCSLNEESSKASEYEEISISDKMDEEKNKAVKMKEKVIKEVIHNFDTANDISVPAVYTKIPSGIQDCLAHDEQSDQSKGEKSVLKAHVKQEAKNEIIMNSKQNKSKGVTSKRNLKENISRAKTNLSEAGQGIMQKRKPNENLDSGNLRNDSKNRNEKAKADLERNSKGRKQEEKQLSVEESKESKINKLVETGLVATKQKAALALNIMEMDFSQEEAVLAANECLDLDSALGFLQQECHLCAGRFTVRNMVAMVRCTHWCCRSCAKKYFEIQVRDKSILDTTCPFCKEPSDLADDVDAAAEYFNLMDILLKNLLDEQYHDMFHKKLRDWTLFKTPNFKWCSKCSSGFITEPLQSRLVCPDCSAVTCAVCLEPWSKDNHAHNDTKLKLCDREPGSMIVEYLNENCVECPRCSLRFTLARGGCMHLTCLQCKFEFCSGCSAPFRMAEKCDAGFPYCEKLGLHAHHPRNCLFYLRDKEPEELCKLLEEKGVPYLRETEPTAKSVVQLGPPKKCQVPIQKETNDGLVDDFCGHYALKGYSTTVCKTHYIEYAGILIWKNNLDPISILSNDDLETIIRRANKKLPNHSYGMKDSEHRQQLLKVITAEVPM